MTDATNHSVVGTDGIVPSYNPEGLWKTWEINEIYTGTLGHKRYVPKVNDHVIEPVTNTRYLVKEIDQVTLIAKLEPLGNNNSLAMSSTDLLFATGPGWPSQNYRIFFDDTVFPYRLDVHSFCQIRSVKAAYAKIILGPLYGPHQVISKVYDAGGNFVSDRVELDLLAVEPGWQNYHIKTIRSFNCTQKLVNGETLTVVLYSQDGHMVGNTVLTVVESNFMRDAHAPQRYITHISLKSPFLSESNPTLLELPLNWNTAAMNLTGVVHHSDGRTVELPVDGRKFSMRGLDQLLSSIAGQEMDMVLHYKMDDDETTTNEVSSHNNGINLPIRVNVVNANYSYTVKLYAYPYWNNSSKSYSLKWYMLNLERNLFREVTQHVRFSTTTGVFDGFKFNAIQRLQVLVNLRDLFPTYRPFVHTQIVEITLYGDPNDYPAPWLVKQVGSDALPYGADLCARLVNNTTLKLDNGLSSDEWLRRVYKQTYPLTEYPEDLDSVIQPTHFQIHHNSQMAEYPIEMFNQEVSLQTVFRRWDTVEILFLRRISSGDLYCSMAAMVIQLED